MANNVIDNDLVLALIDDDEELNFIVEMIFDDELEEDAGRGVHPNYLHSRSFDWWLALEDPDFCEHFRMPRATFELLTEAYENHLRNNQRLIRIRTNLKIALMMGLWILMTGDTFQSTAINFGVSKSVIFFHYIVLIEALREMAPTYISWPDAVERDAIKVRIEQKYGYPGVVGCIDGTNIYVTAPLAQPAAYINRHHSYSILAQVVSDDNLLVRDVYVGEPGSVGDARCFSRSPLFRNLTSRLDMMSDDEHLLGDGAYPISNRILTPFFDDAYLTERQRHHNYILSRVRSSVERLFGMWKSKFRRVKNMYSYNIHYAVDHIIGSFVVHNFIILQELRAQGVFYRNPGAQVNVVQAPVPYDAERAREFGIMKREYIAHLFDAQAEEEL